RRGEVEVNARRRVAPQQWHRRELERPRRGSAVFDAQIILPLEQTPCCAPQTEFGREVASAKQWLNHPGLVGGSGPPDLGPWCPARQGPNRPWTEHSDPL